MEPTCSMAQSVFLCSRCGEQEVRLDATLMRVSASERIRECLRRKLMIVTRTVDGVQRRKRASVSYSLTGVNGAQHVCCKMCFINRLQLTERAVRNAVQCAADVGVYRYQSMQGHRQTQSCRLDHNVQLQFVDFIKQHTNRITTCKTRHHRCLKPDLGMAELWKLYVKNHVKGSRIETRKTFSRQVRAIATVQAPEVTDNCPMCTVLNNCKQSPKVPVDESFLVVKHRPGIGRFVVTSKPIEEGESVVEYRGEIITSKQLKKRNKTYNSSGGYGSFCMEFRHNSRTYCVDATAESKYLGRLVSHSRKSPNLKPVVVAQNRNHHIVLVATKSIPANQMLSYDYGVTDPKMIKDHPWLMD